MIIKPLMRAWMAVAVFFIAGKVLADTNPIKLEVDATEAPRGILHAQLHIPASPGKLTLFYPKWIPGEHSPSGPIKDLTGLKFSAEGKPIRWRRDDDDMFTFHLEMPAGAVAVDAALEFLLPNGSGAFSSGVSSTAKLLDLSWNQVLLYPGVEAPLKLQYAATLKLPGGWKFGTALPLGNSPRNPNGKIEFLPASLETLVDSPVIAGEYFRTIDLSPAKDPPHFLHLVADSAAALEIKPQQIRDFSHLVTEANALFGAHHYGDYHFSLR